MKVTLPAALVSRFTTLGLGNIGLGRLLTISVFMALGATQASADIHTFWHRSNITYQRNRAWPDPFNEVDALQVVSPFAVMKHNGWRAHNTIGSDLFRRGDGELLAAGRNRIEWIATQAPANHKVVYVLQASSRQETDSRVTAVRKLISDMEFNGAPPQILVTHIDPPTQPGPMITKISRDRLEQQPAPVLPQTSAAGTAGVASP